MHQFEIITYQKIFKLDTFSFILAVRKYIVTVTTGDEEDAGTTSNVYVNIMGDSGSTGNRWLKKSTSNDTKFLPKQVSFCSDEYGDTISC